MAKVKIFDKRIIKQFLGLTSATSASLSLLLIFVEIPTGQKLALGGIFASILLIAYIVLWFRSNNLEEVVLNIEGSDVIVKKGDIFEQPGLKAIAFNEYFDTQVDDKIISRQSLNGILITERLTVSAEELDEHIKNYQFEDDEITGNNTTRKAGKKVRYDIGTICVYKDYILTAFSKFDEKTEQC